MEAETAVRICPGLLTFLNRIESAHAIMKGLEINYNFNRKHMALENKTLAEIAIPQLELGINKWLDLIKLSATS